MKKRFIGRDSNKKKGVLFIRKDTSDLYANINIVKD